jgi:hypothetical protein
MASVWRCINSNPNHKTPEYIDHRQVIECDLPMLILNPQFAPTRYGNNDGTLLEVRLLLGVLRDMGWDRDLGFRLWVDKNTLEINVSFLC